MTTTKTRRGPIVLITGTSSGFGRATAARLSSAGMRVFGTSRKPPARESLSFENVLMDVDNDASVAAGVRQVIETAGRIDVLVNNAGIGVAGSVEDTSIEEARCQLETNFFGVVRATQAVLPHMRRQRSGKIVNVSSIGGLVALPFQAFYSASKFAVEALTEALRLELAPFGIRVCCIEPGDFRTAMTDKRFFAKNADSRAYGVQMQATIDAYAHDERNGADPELVARLIERIVAESNPKVRYLVGKPDQKAAALLKRVIPATLFERFLARHCRISAR
jgi:NAD(P)-dependent dehydrogenase (short-subunit alcohol dehydrogenase family)